mmetsp:Transcript_30389/g.62612  ORF Transcript_30389/g.62612 Transcript_30389/m.62612 type:complete len:869 (-) Transcript_30389:3743-6349(-)
MGDGARPMRAPGLEANPRGLSLMHCWKRWGSLLDHSRRVRLATQHYARSVLSGWRRWVLRGGLAAPDICDDEEEVFGDRDPLPVERAEAAKGLQKFLVDGQPRWRLDGGVIWEEPPRDPAMGRIMRTIERALHRRPTEVMQKWEDARESIGFYWELDDFKSLPSELLEMLVECRQLEEKQVEHVRRTGAHVGHTINPAGCRTLGIPEELIVEWTEGTWFQVDDELPHYAKGPYANIYRDMATLLMACREFNKLLRWLIPVMRVPWIESRTTVVSKADPTSPGGQKHRTCTDLSDSGLNDAVELWLMAMPRLMDIISKMGPGARMAKQDLQDMFYSWRVHPKLWTFFGIRHPVTGQSFVFPVLPMGFKLSPAIACRNTELLASYIENEMRARWEDRPSIAPALEAVPRTAAPADGCPPASSVYVDDYMGSAMGEWAEELVDVGAKVFELVGVVEKIMKREGPDQLMCLLGFLFNTLTHCLSIPEKKAREILMLLDSILDRVDKVQSVAHQELSSLVGRLTWSSTAVVLGRAYLQHVRKPLVAVQTLLPRRRDRERFCIPLYHFKEAVAELRWHRAALASGGSSGTIHVGPKGLYEWWKWHGGWGDEVPADVIQWATDASLWGGGYQFLEDYRVREWNRDEHRLHINVLECIVVLHLILEMGPSCRGRRCLGWCDNSTTVAAINTGRSKSNLLMQIVRRVHLACLEFDMRLWMAHIPGVHNIVADGLSRGVLGARVSNWTLVPQCMERWARHVGGAYEVDAFCDEAGLLAKAPIFRASTNGFRLEQFGDKTVWAFPPISLVESFFREVASWRARVVVAMVPASSVPEGTDWRTLHVYPPGARLFNRPVGTQMVRCKGTGFEWAVIEFLGA